ncbi:DUF2318 domain-containing protein [Clostridium sp. KNHs205]|uniref:DUF2318 domain-containing protein n=1 Tax=Clostridium sp. KNHs205 TaxID=1449050 RepID=UPI00069200BD|nr:DUF2318 domain-containing protein [Clostridium sp. KNHs205]
MEEKIIKKKQLSIKNITTVAIGAVLLFLLIVFVVKNGSKGADTDKGEEVQSAGITLNDNSDIVIDTSKITDKASFFETEAGGLTVGLFAVKASDGTIRTAFNTCQVCNGSPYAYFEQKGDNFQCQNCKNVFPTDKIAQERGGCNPVPILEEQRTESNGEIIISSALVEENSIRFQNWKQY